jgi:hypothetical protein
MFASAAALLACAALLLSASKAAPRASGYADAAPPGFSGGFGEPSCHACHFHTELNSGPGRVTIAGVPDRFTPGGRYPLTITLTRPDMKLGGFQLTSRFKDGGGQAGSLATDADERERARIDLRSGVQYANQRRKGTPLSSANTVVWKLIWTAPPAGGPIVLHVAANAADGDDTAEGDYVHTAAAESVPAASADGWRRVSTRRASQSTPPARR